MLTLEFEPTHKLDCFCVAFEQTVAAITDSLNVARLLFRRRGEAALALQNKLQVLAAKAVSSMPTN